MNRDAYQHYRMLMDAGWDIQKHNQVRFNSGSETYIHFLGKCAAAFVGAENGFRVSSEAVHDERGEVDVILYGRPERRIWAVEIETSPVDDVVQDKLERYVHNTPIQEMCLINANEIPMNQLEAKEYVAEQLGFEA